MSAAANVHKFETEIGISVMHLSMFENLNCHNPAGTHQHEWRRYHKKRRNCILHVHEKGKLTHDECVFFAGVVR